MNVSKEDIENIRNLSKRIHIATAEAERESDRTGIPFVSGCGMRYIPEKFYELVQGVDREILDEIISHVDLSDLMYEYDMDGMDWTGWIASELC